MLLGTLLVRSNYLFKYIYILLNSFSIPVTTHLLPLPLYNPIYPVKAVTYADNYRCVANYLLAHVTTPTSTKFT